MHAFKTVQAAEVMVVDGNVFAGEQSNQYRLTDRRTDFLRRRLNLNTLITTITNK